MITLTNYIPRELLLLSYSLITASALLNLFTHAKNNPILVSRTRFATQKQYESIPAHGAIGSTAWRELAPWISHEEIPISEYFLVGGHVGHRAQMEWHKRP
jgi:hypothetical protein